MAEFFSKLPVWAWIVIGIVVLLILILMIFSVAFRKFVYKLVLKAEEKYASFPGKQGDKKFDDVSKRIHAILPKFLQVIFTDQNIEDLINKMVNKMKAKMEKALVNKSKV